jgi:hypothetical protein
MHQRDITEFNEGELIWKANWGTKDYPGLPRVIQYKILWLDYETRRFALEGWGDKFDEMDGREWDHYGSSPVCKTEIEAWENVLDRFKGELASLKREIPEVEEKITYTAKKLAEKKEGVI